MKKVFVTGGAGFIGSAVVRELIKSSEYEVINIDKLTYAGNLESLESVSGDKNYHFEKVDICDRPKIKSLFEKYHPNAILHLAAESHVDRSIDSPSQFMETNIMGTFSLLEESRNYIGNLDEKLRNNFRFLHVSTDEVYGALGNDGKFTEETAYRPNSPYSASKAASDHLVRAWHHTYGLPTLTTNCSNNYGCYHFPEKLIPLVTLNAIDEKPLPVYGKGENVRDWLFVEDHARAIRMVLERGRVGETYNVGGNEERKNIEVVEAICEELDKVRPRSSGKSHKELITFVKDRPGHDFRYAIDSSKLMTELGWKPEETFNSGIKKTVHWVLENKNGWCKRVLDGSYKLERLGQI